MKKSCMPKNDVTEGKLGYIFKMSTLLLVSLFLKEIAFSSEEIGEIEQGKFIEDRRVMCYVACVYAMTQVVSTYCVLYLNRSKMSFWQMK